MSLFQRCVIILAGVLLGLGVGTAITWSLGLGTVSWLWS